MLVQLGTPVRRLITFALVAMMMFASILSPTPTLAQNQTIQSSLTGVTISYGPPYELQEDGRFADDVMETMMFLGSADILAMGFMSPLVDLNGARDIMLEALFGEIGSASTIDRGDYTGVSYSLDMLNIDGMEMGVFSLFMNQRSHGFSEFYIFLAPPAFFGTAMQTAQNSFTIDGNQLMDGVDAIAMGNMVTANIGTTGGTAVTDVTEVTENTSETDEPDTTQTDTVQTGSDQADTGDMEEADRLAYLLLVTFEFQAVDQSLLNIWTTVNDLANEDISAQDARIIMDEEQAFLSGTNDRIAAIEVPPNMQTFHQETLTWSDAVTNSGVSWFNAINGTGSQDEAFDALNHATEIHLEFGDTLQAENMAGANTAPDTETSETTESGSTTTEATDTTETTTRTTRTTDAGSSDDSTETTRTTRTTGSTSSDETSGDSDTTSRPDRSTRSTGTTSSGNTSETSGQTDTTVSAHSNELTLEGTGVNISWNDDLALDDRDGEAVSSNPSSSEDQIQFQATTKQGNSASFSLLVQANSGSDATVAVNSLVNDPTARANVFADDVEIIDSEIASGQSAILVYAVDDLGPYYVYLQVTCVTENCDTLATLIVLVDDGANMADVLGTIESGLAVNDTPVSGAIPAVDIDDGINRFSN